jgi:5-methylcytosine-specific restriction endonuclease McrA
MNKPTKNKIWKIEEMEADHITPWHLGGKTVDENCQMLCKTFNREKSGH